MASDIPTSSECLSKEQQRSIYKLQFDLSQLNETQLKTFSGHSLNSQFSIAILISLHYLTFGIFTVIYFGSKFSKLPIVRNNDLTAGKAIGFSFIPFFNAYWLFRFWLSLVDRINFQLRLIGQPWAISRGFTSAAVITGVIPFVNFLISYLILFPIVVGQIQGAINKLAVARQPAPTWEQLSLVQERSIYSSQFDTSQLTEPQRMGFGKHSFKSTFPIVIVMFLHFITSGWFTYIYFALKHSKLPIIKKDDFEWPKAIDFLSIPLFNFYWMFEFWLRLVDRINFQFKLRSQDAPVSKVLTTSSLVVWIISFIVSIVISIQHLASNGALSPDYLVTTPEPNLSDLLKLIFSPYKLMIQSIYEQMLYPNILYTIPSLISFFILIFQIQNATNKLAKINLINH